LTQARVREIPGLLLEGWARRVELGTGIRLEWDDSALNYLANRGYEPAYGARPLKRLIQQEAETAISRMIIKGDIKARETITLHGGEGGLVVTIR